MKGKIIKGIAGFYYVHVADVAMTMGTVYEWQGKRSLLQGHRKPLDRGDVRWMSWMRHRKKEISGNCFPDTVN